MVWSIAALMVGSYLLGAIPFGLVVTQRLAQADVRTIGSGNIGATNVARAAGRKVALLVLVLDVLKGFVPSIVAARLFPEASWAPVLVGLCAVLGHVFPIYMRFRGGKGVATALGVCLALVPWAALVGVALYALIWATTRLSSLGSLCAAAGGLVTALLLETPLPRRVLLGVLVLLILVRHRSNIGRLLRGQEHRT